MPLGCAAMTSEYEDPLFLGLEIASDFAIVLYNPSAEIIR